MFQTKVLRVELETSNLVLCLENDAVTRDLERGVLFFY